MEVAASAAASEAPRETNSGPDTAIHNAANTTRADDSDEMMEEACGRQDHEELSGWRGSVLDGEETPEDGTLAASGTGSGLRESAVSARRSLEMGLLSPIAGSPASGVAGAGAQEDAGGVGTNVDHNDHWGGHVEDHQAGRGPWLGSYNCPPDSAASSMDRQHHYPHQHQQQQPGAYVFGDQWTPSGNGLHCPPPMDISVSVSFCQV